MTAEQKFKVAVLLLIAILLIGTLGYMGIEKLSPLNALYMTVITISTVGFKEVKDLSPAGIGFTILLIIGSVSMVAYGITVISSFILEGHFREIGRTKKMKAEIDKIKEHYIVCGISRTARQVIQELQRARVPFLVIASDSQNLEKEAGEVLHIEGDPTDDEVLKKSQVEKAKGLIACLSSDTDNVFVTLSARALNPKLKIVAQASGEISESKMLKAGADKVISPEVIGGRRMASIILRPTVVSFLDIMTRGGEDVTLRLEEVNIPPSSPLSGKSITETEIRRKTGTLVVGIKKEQTGRIRYNPSSSTVLEDNDILLVLGDEESITKLCSLCEKSS